MKRTSKTLIALTLALLWMPACDKPSEDKAAAKTDDKPVKTDEKPAAAEPASEPAEPAADPDTAEVAADGRVAISVDAKGYHPETISAPAKSKITLAFTRATESGCGQQLVIKDLDISKELPLNEVVEIEVEVPETGELGFACGMDMYRGKVIPKA